jgi:hypothetical protein
MALRGRSVPSQSGQKFSALSLCRQVPNGSPPRPCTKMTCPRAGQAPARGWGATQLLMFCRYLPGLISGVSSPVRLIVRKSERQHYPPIIAQFPLPGRRFRHGRRAVNHSVDAPNKHIGKRGSTCDVSGMKDHCSRQFRRQPKTDAFNGHSVRHSCHLAKGFVQGWKKEFDR